MPKSNFEISDEKLLQIANDAKSNSYSPYSEFKVGAALLTENHRIFKGCNVENSSYGAAICAERTAVVKAVSEGERKFLKLAVVSSSEDYTFPCGICRQVLSEFMPDGEVILSDKDGNIKKFLVSELIPHSFKL